MDRRTGGHAAGTNRSGGSGTDRQTGDLGLGWVVWDRPPLRKTNRQRLAWLAGWEVDGWTGSDKHIQPTPRPTHEPKPNGRQADHTTHGTHALQRPRSISIPFPLLTSRPPYQTKHTHTPHTYTNHRCHSQHRWLQRHHYPPDTPPGFSPIFLLYTISYHFLFSSSCAAYKNIVIHLARRFIFFSLLYLLSFLSRQQQNPAGEQASKRAFGHLIFFFFSLSSCLLLFPLAYLCVFLYLSHFTARNGTLRVVVKRRTRMAGMFFFGWMAWLGKARQGRAMMGDTKTCR